MSDETVPNTTTVVADVGATFVRVALARGVTLGSIKERRVAGMQRGTDDGIVPGIVELMQEAIAAGFDGRPTPVAAAGIGVCAAVDDSGSLQRSLPFGVPRGRRVVEIVGASLGVPVAIDNDANMAALGELHHGVGRGLRDFLLITLGTNIGMGIVEGGRVLRGSHGGAGEGGMMLVPARSLDRPVNEGGRSDVDAGRFGVHPSRAPEGYAWVEELVGGGALARALSERRGVANHGTERRTAPMRILAEATAGDSDATRVVDRAIEGWAYAIANCVALLDPAAIVLSGGLTEDIGPFVEELRRRAAELSRTEPQILVAELGSLGGLIGASMAALKTVRMTVRQQATSEVRSLEGTALITTATAGADSLRQPTTDLVWEWSEPDELKREIGEGPEAVRQTLAELHRCNRGIVKELVGTHHVMLLGTGASLAMARCAEALWRISDQTTGVPRTVMALEASEALFARSRDLTDKHAAIVVVSKSGRSPESLAVAEMARRAGGRVIAITSDAGSPLAAAASDVVVTPIGHEHGAATKSEAAALAALLALGGVVATDADAVDLVTSLLSDALGAESGIVAAGAAVGTARRIWTVGFGASRGVAEALALLLHEKAQLPAVAGTPSGFRHGLVEASAAGDSVVVIECGHEDPLLTAYLGRLADEGQRVGLRMVWLAGQDRIGLNIPLRGSTLAERALEAVLRAQQLAHAAAHAAGTYTDGFRVLRAIVAPGDPFV